MNSSTLLQYPTEQISYFQPMFTNIFCLFDYSFLFVTLQKVKTKQENHETRRKSKSPGEMSHVFPVLLKVTKALINGSLRSLYFLNFVNDRTIFSSCAMEFESSGLIICLECTVDQKLPMFLSRSKEISGSCKEVL